MPRIIKFRAKIKGDAEVYEVLDIDWLNLRACIYRACGNQWVSFDKIQAFLQFIDKLDKNGKEIFEGDILGGMWGEGHISYCDNCKSFEYFMREFGCSSCSGDTFWSEVVESNFLEVIGNIWENPELLE